MDLLTKARRLESRIARTLDSAAQRVVGATAREPLEVLHAIADLVEQEVQPGGRGQRVFPYNSVTVTIVAASPKERARYDAVLACRPTLRERIADSLRAAGAEVPELTVSLDYASEADPAWTAAEFNVELARVAEPVEALTPIESPVRPSLGLTITHGSGEQPTYSLALARIDLGRGREVRDTRNHLLRTNHVAFTDAADDVSASVSRRHAHIVRDDDSNCFRIYDDGSAQGTQVLRNGATILVRTGSRGIRLREGDEIVLGEARVKVSLLRSC